jgi:hypothetical protein
MTPSPPFTHKAPLILTKKDKVMKNISRSYQCILLVLLSLLFGASNAVAQNSLPSWKDRPAKKAIIEFVSAVTNEKGSDFVEPSKRIAVFDHDGTLWVEYPMYTQVLFAFERVKQLAPQHPEWKTQQPFKALLAGDMKTVGASGMKGLLEILMATHAGMTAAEFEKLVLDWLAI